MSKEVTKNLKTEKKNHLAGKWLALRFSTRIQHSSLEHSYVSFPVEQLLLYLRHGLKEDRSLLFSPERRHTLETGGDPPI